MSRGDDILLLRRMPDFFRRMPGLKRLPQLVRPGKVRSGGLIVEAACSGLRVAAVHGLGSGVYPAPG
jgi:hypothetical protein